MGWEYRRVDQHACKKPVSARDIAVGDIWSCDECKARYRVTAVTLGQYDQRDGYYGGKIQWEALPPDYNPNYVTSWRDQ